MYLLHENFSAMRTMNDGKCTVGTYGNSRHCPIEYCVDYLFEIFVAPRMHSLPF